MSEIVAMPVLGESVTEGTVTTWLKQVGEVVALDEPLLEVSTDKVDTEVPSPVAGVLLKILVSEDETVDVGTPLAVVGSALELEAEPSEPAAPVPAPTVPNPEIPSTVTITPEGKASVEWSYPSVPPIPPKAAESPVVSPETTSQPVQPVQPVLSPIPPVTPERSTTPTDATAPSTPPAPPVAPAVEPPRDASVTGGYITPIVRKLAAEKGVDLSQVTGTGVGGRIRKQDVLDAAGVFPQDSTRPATPPLTPPPLPTPPVMTAPVLPAVPAIPPTSHEAASPSTPTPPVPTMSPAVSTPPTPPVPSTPLLPASPATPVVPVIPTAAPRTATGELDVARLAQLFAEVAAAFDQNKTTVEPTETPVPAPIPAATKSGSDFPSAQPVSHAAPPAPPVPPMPPAVSTTPAPPAAPLAPTAPPAAPVVPFAPPASSAAPTPIEPPNVSAPNGEENPIVMPALGESVTEGTVTTWLKQVGDAVTVDEPLLEVSTDKVDTEVPSPISGVISQILVKEDETVEVGAILAYVR
ncbi:biotin/lipoyl-containing protein [Mobiluncus mulieris]|uniref:Dihydrolipoyllysine succinyltransferase n=1 Tax=Mobiluncus mulieris TaxID=2052 RepID=A0ABD4TTM8_9ACTO|nr:biotin/lipoyl-containing protein [Mobiluncus mulieris]MCU9968270.1 dihydrolipoyllysine succinyltransferase [Mobiluncus mulieris]MCU9972449.1 dihydrolipoyllysine succinyltransferase [Mobiluncus mulieris]MCV0008539.1 dihydrolipoyllysine succinyltransferase [Mobiluncus mulieris]MCV0010606.1 dihydrolipoyllysine succinyltransferase [Mobiluncus mulieris]NMW74405.1 dihydrolipoyllysine succinyltransferase [Mobiluncus mulieris]